ncbi:MAG: hypothetical protein ACKVOO_04970 [Burkholderiaceae bacterium]
MMEEVSEDALLHWQEQALVAIEAGQNDGMARLYLRRMGCPPEIAHRLVAECRQAAKADHRQRGLVMLITGSLFGIPLALLAAFALVGIPIWKYEVRSGGLMIVAAIGAFFCLSSALLGAYKLLTGSVRMTESD